MTTVPPRWRKSSRSAGQANCVELAHTLDAVRDSKNPTWPALRLPVGGLLAAVKDNTIG